MSHLEELYEVKNKIKAMRILVGLSGVLMFISIYQGHNSIGLLFLGLTLVFLCMLTHVHSDRIYIEQLYTGGE